MVMKNLKMMAALSVALFATVIYYNLFIDNKRDFKESYLDSIEGQILLEVEKLQDQKTEEMRASAFLYNDDYTARISFRDGSKKYWTVKDKGFGLAAEYHKVGLCFVEVIEEMDSSSDLYKTVAPLGYDFYSSCPIVVNGQLVGYIGAVFSYPELQPMRWRTINRLELAANRAAKILEPKIGVEEDNE